MADEKKCSAINHPSLVPSWGCCACKTLNGNQPDRCKFCDHERCDNPAVKRVPVQTSSGIAIATVDMDGKVDKSKVN
jgi:hypothetical protein